MSVCARRIWRYFVAVTILEWVGCTALKPGDLLPPSNDDASSIDGRDAGRMDSDMTGEGAAEANGDGSDATEADDRETIARRRAVALPSTIDPMNLRLWLAADKGVTCAAGQVTSWADQSPYHDDATIQNGQLGPQCQTGPAHAVNGVDLPYFSAPVSTTNPNNIDETLDVDLGFLVGASYTMFAVERRWADYGNGDQTHAELILGTLLPLPDGAAIVPNDGVALGYIYYNGHTELTLDQHNNTIDGPVPRVPSPPPSSFSVDTGQFDNSLGHTLWVNGVQIASSTNLIGLNAADGGAIGRAFTSGGSSYDDRFRGDIAEVIIYDAALDDPSRIEVESYLKNHWHL